MNVKNSIHGGNIWAAARKHSCSPERFIDFSANINPLGPSPFALEAIHKGIDMVQHYPDPEATELKMKLSHYLSVPENNLLLGNGGAEIIYALCRALNPKRLVLPVPTFSEYREALSRVPIEPVFLQAENNFALPVELISKTMQPGDAVFICNPNNPTGFMVSKSELIKLSVRAREVGATLVVDEAFMDFAGHKETVLPHVLENQHAVVVGSLTKFFALPGLRLGYLAADKALIHKVNQQLPPWRVNLLAQMAGEASLEDENYMEETLQIINREREFLYQGLNNITGLKPYPSRTNFILVNCSATGITAEIISNKLADNNILVRVADNFPGLDKYYFRVAVRKRYENELLLKNLRSIQI
ncbi:MAG: threonine-phosphate decarboxylase [Firmicutes bacterium]|nr:threonine-phosphate decarboxylase [Bacillota bacterium]